MVLNMHFYTFLKTENLFFFLILRGSWQRVAAFCNGSFDRLDHSFAGARPRAVSGNLRFLFVALSLAKFVKKQALRAAFEPAEGVAENTLCVVGAQGGDFPLLKIIKNLSWFVSLGN